MPGKCELAHNWDAFLPELGWAQVRARNSRLTVRRTARLADIIGPQCCSNDPPWVLRMLTGR
jgi:hypothetical protein